MNKELSECYKFFEKGRSQLNESNIEEALNIAEKLSLRGKQSCSNGLVLSIILKAAINMQLRQFEDGYVKYKQALNIAKKINDKQIQSLIYNHLGRWNAEVGNLNEGIEYMKKSLKINPEDISSLNNIGIAYARNGKYEKAYKYFLKRYNIVKKQDNSSELVRSLSNLGLVLASQKKYDEALDYYLKALKICNKSDDIGRLSNLYNSIGNLFLDKSEFEKSQIYTEKAVEFATESHNNEELERSKFILYQIYKNNKKHEKAYKAIEECRELQTLRFQEIMKNKIETLEKTLIQERKISLKKEKILQEVNENIKLKLKHFENAYKDIFGIGEIGVFSNKMQKILKIAKFYHTDRNVPVLIEGETGTGKEIIARYIHFGQDGNTKPFVSINCAAISPSLFESELFGYVEGAFTGARKGGMPGKLELANHGTLFLDEIGEMPLELQPKLLRVLQEKEFYRIGGSKLIKTDIRIICATNRNLKNETEKKRFRSDLYYRLSIGKIHIPPLRERVEEIGPLAHLFMKKFAKEKKKSFKDIDKTALRAMQNYRWPGNIRELKNTIERIVLLNNEESIKLKHLNFIFGNMPSETVDKSNKLIIEFPEEQLPMKKIKKIVVSKVLNKFEGNKTKAADYLMIARKTMYHYCLKLEEKNE